MTKITLKWPKKLKISKQEWINAWYNVINFFQIENIYGIKSKNT
jgi:hypothetical protein